MKFSSRSAFGSLGHSARYVYLARFGPDQAGHFERGDGRGGYDDIDDSRSYDTDTDRRGDRIWQGGTDEHTQQWGTEAQNEVRNQVARDLDSLRTATSGSLNNFLEPNFRIRARAGDTLGAAAFAVRGIARDNPTIPHAALLRGISWGTKVRAWPIGATSGAATFDNTMGNFGNAEGREYVHGGRSTYSFEEENGKLIINVNKPVGAAATVEQSTVEETGERETGELTLEAAEVALTALETAVDAGDDVATILATLGTASNAFAARGAAITSLTGLKTALTGAHAALLTALAPLNPLIATINANPTLKGRFDSLLSQLADILGKKADNTLILNGSGGQYAANLATINAAKTALEASEVETAATNVKEIQDRVAELDASIEIGDTNFDLTAAGIAAFLATGPDGANITALRDKLTELLNNVNIITDAAIPAAQRTIDAIPDGNPAKDPLQTALNTAKATRDQRREDYTAALAALEAPAASPAEAASTAIDAIKPLIDGLAVEAPVTIDGNPVNVRLTADDIEAKFNTITGDTEKGQTLVTLDGALGERTTQIAAARTAIAAARTAIEALPTADQTSLTTEVDALETELNEKVPEHEAAVAKLNELVTANAEAVATARVAAAEAANTALGTPEVSINGGDTALSGAVNAVDTHWANLPDDSTKTTFITDVCEEVTRLEGVINPAITLQEVARRDVDAMANGTEKTALITRLTTVEAALNAHKTQLEALKNRLDALEATISTPLPAPAALPVIAQAQITELTTTINDLNIEVDDVVYETEIANGEVRVSVPDVGAYLQTRAEAVDASNNPVVTGILPPVVRIPLADIEGIPDGTSVEAFITEQLNAAKYAALEEGVIPDNKDDMHIQIEGINLADYIDTNRDTLRFLAPGEVYVTDESTEIEDLRVSLSGTDFYIRRDSVSGTDALFYQTNDADVEDTRIWRKVGDADKFYYLNEAGEMVAATQQEVDSGGWANVDSETMYLAGTELVDEDGNPVPRAQTFTLSGGKQYWWVEDEGGYFYEERGDVKYLEESDSVYSALNQLWNQRGDRANEVKTTLTGTSLAGLSVSVPDGFSTSGEQEFRQLQLTPQRGHTMTVNGEQIFGNYYLPAYALENVEVDAANGTITADVIESERVGDLANVEQLEIKVRS